MSTQAPPAQPIDPAVDPSGHQPDRPSVAPGSERPTGRRRRPRFGIQSKLLVMLLATSILSCLVVGDVGYTSGKNALQDSEVDRLTQVRESRARETPRSSIN